MARVFSNGFELQTLTNGVEWTVNGSTGASAISTTTVHGSSLASGRFNPTTGACGEFYTYAASDSSATFYGRGYLYIAALPTSISGVATNGNSDVTIMGFQNSGGFWVEVTLDAAGKIRLYQDGNARSIVGSASAALSTNAWHRIELAYGSAASYVECLVDGVSIGNTTSASGLGTQSQFAVGIGLANESCSADLFWDDIAVNDTTGSNQTSWPGAGSIAHLQPNAAGDNNSFSVAVGGIAGAANNYTRVSEVTPDDITSYNGGVLNTEVDDFNITNTPGAIGSNDTINVVSVGVRYRAAVASAEASFKVRVKKASGGTVSSSSAITPNSTTWVTNANTIPHNYPITLYQDPDNSNWTKTMLDTAQIGYNISTTNTNAADISAVWLLVDSTPGISSLAINVSDSLAITENITPLITSFINVNNSLTTTENLDIIRANGRDIPVSDTIASTENVNQYINAFFVNVSDSSTISDTNYAFNLISFINVSDTITTTENLSFLDSDIDSISDNLSTSENLRLALTDNISLSNTTTTTESLSFLTNPMLLSISDPLTTVENLQPLVPNLVVNVSDSLALTENYSVFVPDINTLLASANDSLTTSENLNLLIPTLYIVVNDTTTTSESKSFVVSYNIAVTNSLSISENISFLDEDLDLVSDSLSVSENLSLLVPELYISLSDSLTTAENLSFGETETINVSDNSSLSDNLNLTASPGLKITDNLATTINAQVQLDLNLALQNSLTTIESLSIAQPGAGTFIAVAADSLAVGENLSLFIPTITLIASDTIAYTEMVSVVGKTAFINVSDSISMLDVASAGSIGIKTSDTISHSESINIHIQARIQKSYLYKISRNNKFIGILQNVTSEFGYAQDINTGGSQCNITVALSADTQDQLITPLLDELGNTLTDEAGNPLLIERQPDIIGNDNDNILMRNDNDIQIYEFSDYWPNGKLMFSGYISSVEAMFGADDGDVINLTVLSDGSEVSEYLIESGTNNDQTQLFQNSFDTLRGVVIKSGGYNEDGQSFTVGGGVTNVSAIIVKLQGSGSPQNVEVSLFDAPNGILLATVSQTINSNAIADYIFTFISPVPVTSGQVYFFSIAQTDPNDFIGVNIFYQNNAIYGAGDMYSNNYGGAGGGSFTVTPSGTIPNQSDLYFKTLTTTNATEATYTNFDPTDILSDIMLNYNNKGGRVVLDPYVQSTGLGASYTFNVNSVAEGIDTLLKLAPNGWYWYIDVATKLLYFQPTAPTAQYKFIRGRHISSLQLKSTIDNLKNVVYFSGGNPGGGNVYVKYTNTDSLAANNNRVGMDRISDSNVLDTTTGLVLAKDDSNQHMSEEYLTQISIIDTTMDITLPHVGDTIGFEGYGSFVDKLVLQITRITYTPDVLTITVGTLPRRVHKDIQKLKDQLIALQVQNNTASPTPF